MRAFNKLTAMVCMCLLSQSISAGGYKQDHLKVSGDPVAGKELYFRCVACHSLGRNRTGPLHCGLIGRRAGSVEGFEYSDAMKKSDVIWDATALDKFLTSPLEFIPGTTMGFSGVKDMQARRDLIAYLNAAIDLDECL